MTGRKGYCVDTVEIIVIPVVQFAINYWFRRRTFYIHALCFNHFLLVYFLGPVYDVEECPIDQQHLLKIVEENLERQEAQEPSRVSNCIDKTAPVPKKKPYFRKHHVFHVLTVAICIIQ